MAEDLPVHIDRLPTLTEVLDLGARPAAPPLPGRIPGLPGLPFDLASLPVLAEALDLPDDKPRAATVTVPVTPSAAPAPAATVIDQAALLDQLVAALLPRIDELLHARLSAALAPALARATETLVRDTREELLQAVRGLAADSLAQALHPDAGAAGQSPQR